MAKTPETIRRLAKIAVDVEKRFGIPAELVLAQVALESGWLSKAPGNNTSGIKWSPTRHGERKQLLRTREYMTRHQAEQWERQVPGRKILAVLSQPDSNGKQWFSVLDWFAAYDSIEDCILDYARLLTKNPRYTNAITAAGGWPEVAHAVARSGYATDPDYAQKLIAIVDEAVAAQIAEARKEA